MTEDDRAFARVAVKNKLMTDEQAEECLAACDESWRFAKVAVEKGYLTSVQAQKVTEAIEKHISQRRPAVGAAPAAAPASSAAAPKAAPSAPVGRPAAAAPAPQAAVAPVSEAAAPVTASPEMKKEMAAGMDWSPLQGKNINAYLETARNCKTSDLHLNTGASPMIRVNGQIRYTRHQPLSAADVERFISQLLLPEEQAVLARDRQIDLCYVSKQGNRYRCSVYHQRLGPAIIARIVPDAVKSLEELGLPPEIEKFTEYHQGLVLVTGPAGSGKTATLAALVDMINAKRNDHVISLEDPIEIVHPSRKALVSQREVGPHTESFSSALRAALREDPDIIVVGELRDLETISLAITAAETGHLVIGTLHTANAARTIDRLLDVFPPEEQAQIRAMVAESLRGIICQSLIPRADGKGMALAVELLFMNRAVRNLISDARTFQLRSLLQTGRAHGMRLMDESIKELVTQGVVAVEEAQSIMEDPAVLTK